MSNDWKPISEMANDAIKKELERIEQEKANTVTVEATTEGAEVEVATKKWGATLAAFFRSTWKAKPTAGVKVEKKW